MSSKVTSEVYRYTVPSTQRAVLLAFAEHVNAERAEHGDTTVWPSLGRIAWMTGLDRRTVALATQALVASGALVEVSKARYHYPAAYRIVLSALPLKRPYAESSSAAPPLRGGALPPLNPSGEAVRMREEAVPTSSRGGAAPPKPTTNRNEPIDSQPEKINGEDDTITVALKVIATVVRSATNLARIGQRLAEFRARRPNVDLGEQVRRWAARAAASPVRNAEAALFAWLDLAQDAEPDTQDALCPVVGCDRRGRGALGRCVEHTWCSAAGCKALGTAARDDGLVVCTEHGSEATLAPDIVQMATTGFKPLPMTEPSEVVREVREWWAGILAAARATRITEATA